MHDMHDTGEVPVHATARAARFGMPQALVLVAFLAAAVTLSLFAGMSARDVTFLLSAAGGVGVAVVLTAGAHTYTHTEGGRRGGAGRLVRRLLNAALNNGAGS
ncbi:hypothetical protein GPA10_27805 [Streptomyces sp. p1417]|uniref:Uncharacterized protein n=1 Tax=Streptomyces typhae TaxID=2681492 RepID=A0A6L6X3N7_9ACTN|nr:hypothetical protein [Streptomyces typhae]MVO88464.1 hypothetical protein [Streptomyces typhae]